MKHRGAVLCMSAWFLLLVSAPAFANCNVDAYVTKGTKRLSGNSMRGFVVAWADNGDWWNWQASVHGEFSFKPSGGNSWNLLGSGDSNWGPVTDDWSDPDYSNPYWSAVSYLESNGSGDYAVYGWGSFSCWSGQVYEDHVDAGMVDQAVVRPVISPPGGTYGSDRWAFWYLGGQPSIDNYYVQAALSANNKLGGSNYTGGTPSYDWEELSPGSKVSFSPTNSTQTAVTSQAASDEAIYDVRVHFYVDGFASDPLYLAINTPIAAEAVLVDSQDHAGVGYDSYVQYEIVDLWTEMISPITVNETHGNESVGGCPLPRVGWGPPSADVWPTALWVENQYFFDDIFAYDGTNTWNPHPRPPFAGSGCVVGSAPQGIYAGSATNGQGVQVGYPTQVWHDDHGEVQ